jgi:S1-C subfamily serine protease
MLSIIKPDSDFYTKKWVGKCTGFFISSKGKILTTYDAIADAKSIRVKGEINGKKFVLPAKIVRTEEDVNMAVLQVEDSLFKAFDELPFGYKDIKPASETNAFSVGYPNATAGILTRPEVYYGKVLPNSSSSSANDRVLEMSFRYE